MKYYLGFILLFVSFLGYGQYTSERVSLETTFISCVKYNLIGRPEKAVDTLQILFKENPNHPAIAYELSKSYEQLEKWSESLQYATIATEKSTKNAYQKHLAEVAMRAEDYDVAISAWKPLFQKEKNNEEYGDKLATAYLLKGDFQNAIKTYDELENNIGISENISRRKIEVYDIAGNRKGMEKELVKLTETFPEDILYLKNLAKFYQKYNPEKVAAVFAKAKKIDPTIGQQPKKEIKSIDIPTMVENQDLDFSDFGKWDEEMKALLQSKKYEYLLSKSEMAIDNFPNDAKGYWYNGKALNALGKYEEGKKILEEGTIVASGDEVLQSQIFSEMAASFIGQKNIPKAKDLLNMALKLNKDNAVAVKLLKKL